MKSNYMLIDNKTGRQIQLGESLVNFRGQPDRFVSILQAPNGGSSGKIQTDRGIYYPSVFGSKLIRSGVRQ